jgi:cytochrome c peroxidase
MANLHGVIGALLLAYCLAGSAQTSVAAPVELEEPIRPLPLSLDLDKRKVELGRKLFFDTRLSKDNTVSCASCHDFGRGGADPRPRSVGVRGQLGGVNAPSVFNSAFNFRQLWSGRAVSLEEQVDIVIKLPKVMDTNWDEILSKLSQDSALVAQFNAAYTDGLQSKNVMSAIATFERSLITPSRFDRYLRGDPNAITEDEKRGYERFKNYGCVACHQGVNVGGNMFQVFGVMNDYFKDRGNVKDPDLGRYLVTKKDADKHVFKVPSLRNVAMTAPYFHDASARTLDQAIDVMFKYQLGRTAPDEDKRLIAAFLASLTGELKEEQQ